MGQRKKTPADQERVRLWYRTVKSFMGMESWGCRKVGSAFEEMLQSRISPKHIPTPEAWRWYSIGRFTPRPSTVKAIDEVLIDRGAHALSWILAPSGKLRLALAWAWSPFLFPLADRAGIVLTAQVEAQLWEHMPPGYAPDFCAEAGVLKNHGLFDPEEIQKSLPWPPLMRLPESLLRTWARPEDDLPHPVLFESPPCGHNPANPDWPSDLGRLQEFVLWSRSGKAAQADGKLWGEMIIACLLPSDDIREGDFLQQLKDRQHDDLLEKIKQLAKDKGKNSR